MSFFAMVLAFWAVLAIPPLCRLGSTRDRARYAIALGFLVTGISHFATPERFLPMMPPWLPWHLELVYVSGVVELAGAVGLFIPRLARPAALGLTLLLLAVFPANVHAALTGAQAAGMPSAPWYLWVRLPFQAVYIAWLLLTMPRPVSSRADDRVAPRLHDRSLDAHAR